MLFTSDYLDSVSIFRIYLILLPFRIVAYRTILQAVGKTKHIFVAVKISLILNIILGITFEKIFGLCGPAVALVIGELAGSGYMLWQTKLYLKSSLSELIPLKELSHPLLVSAIVGIVILPISFLNLPILMILTTSALLYLVIYVLLMKLFKFFTENDWDIICRWATLQVLRAR